MRPYLNISQLFAYGLLSMPLSLSGTLLIAFIPTYYAIDLGLGLGLVGGLFVAGRLLDVITDPLIGLGSDRTRSRYGARLPWMFIGALAFVPLLWLLIMPGEAISPLRAGLIIGALFVAYTVLDLPYSAIGLELSPHRHERTVLASVKAAFQVAGAISAALIVAAFPDAIARAFSLSGALITGLVILGLFLFVRWVPPYPAPSGTPPRVKAALAAIWRQKPYRRLMSAFLLTQTGSALIFGLTALFILTNFGGGALTGAFILLVLVSSAAALPLWLRASRRFGKVRTWQAALILGAAALWLVPILTPGHILQFAVFCIIVGSVFGADAVLPTSLLADISDAMTTDQAGHAGLMLGYKNALSKLGFVAPMGLAFPVLGAMGLDEGASANTAQLWALIFFYALLPALLRMAAFTIIRRMDPSDIHISEDSEISEGPAAA